MTDKMPEVGDIWELYGVKNYVLQHDEKLSVLVFCITNVLTLLGI